MDSMGSLTDDPELRQSLLSFIVNGGGIMAIHAAIDTFVQGRNTISGPSSPKYSAPPRTAVIPGSVSR
jgi:hypothetical protein